MSSGKPLPPEIRVRIMKLLDDGVPVREIAHRFMVSRSSVYRVQATPEPKPSGGFRHSNLDRAQIVAIAKLAVQKPKSTAAELLHDAIDAGIISNQVGVSSVYRALHKTGLHHGRMTWIDPKITTDPLIVRERRLFREHQKRDPLFRADRLVWMDESNYRLWEQAKFGWKAKGGKGILYRPKGTSPYVSVFLSIGAPDLIQYTIYTPEREYEALQPTYQASELHDPGKGIRMSWTRQQIQHELTKTELKDIMDEHDIKASNSNGGLLSKSLMAELVVQLKTKGKLGLPRAGRKDVGGRRQSVINSTGDVLTYLNDDLFPYLAEHKALGHRSLVWDNASTHAAPSLKNPRAVSFLHLEAQEQGMDGVIFLPPRSPELNPVELAFAWTKHWIRKSAPDEGYTQDALIAAIHRAFGMLQQRVDDAEASGEPTILENWARKCGYVQGLPLQRLPSSSRHHRRRTHAPIWADVNGTICSESRPGLEDIYAGGKGEKDSNDGNNAIDSNDGTGPRRWPGYGSGEPRKTNRIVMKPAMPNVAVLDDDVYEIDEIIDERKSDNETEYLVSWVGYPERTWLSNDDLVAGRETLLKKWAAKQKRANKVKNKRADIFIPERILNERKRAHRKEYLIKWQDYPESEATWEPARNILRGKADLLQEWARKAQ